MKNNRKFLLGMLTVIVALLVACGDASDESSVTLSDNAPQNDESSHSDSTENASNMENANTDNMDQENNDVIKKEDTTNNEPVKEAPSTKNEYIEKLNAAKKESEELEAPDSSTYALKKVEDDRFDIWDQLLNEIYGELKEQLPPEKMDPIREEQRNWIDHRDDSALEASLKYKGGTQEHLEYVAVLANLTEKRCFELVEDYL
ncbi:lysozyme inhibitor LprI family protein [Aquibacillus rhizosphaerae]|uniref:DUF1311 domain-containing protein n=1 Tax=Aquibacillus rhizosphaerae TaxID=3051431 RepID=A0ABT7L0P6_9BACI|nr:lysozyme inhibitor LprI family protein [Aquibacillus sp. LR5S19]MDL4839411.1 DUF1311 domain-containing protein [Aquibacillus sp. LR5S19]